MVGANRRLSRSVERVVSSLKKFIGQLRVERADDAGLENGTLKTFSTPGRPEKSTTTAQRPSSGQYGGMGCSGADPFIAHCLGPPPALSVMLTSSTVWWLLMCRSPSQWMSRSISPQGDLSSMWSKPDARGQARTARCRPGRSA
jgi:hypothetical protein